MKQALYVILANKLLAIANCVQSKNTEWQTRHENDLIHLVKEFMPSGSGIDAECQMDYDASNPEKLVFTTSYHHMNEAGYYDGWTEHKVIVTPSLVKEFALKITGRDRNEIKEYLHEVFYSALTEGIDHDEKGYFSPRLRESAAKFRADVAAGKVT